MNTEREKRALLISPCIPSLLCLLLILLVPPLSMNYIAGMALLIAIAISYLFTIILYISVIRYLKTKKLISLYSLTLCGTLFGLLIGFAFVSSLKGFRADFEEAFVFISWTSGFGFIIAMSFYLIAYKNEEEGVVT